MEILHLPKVEGMMWAKLNPETNLLEFFSCVDSGYYKQEDFTQVTNEYMDQYIEDNYPNIDPSSMPPGFEPTNGIDTRDPNAYLVIGTE